MLIESPYAAWTTPWLRGNLHAHTQASDGARSPQAVVDAYAAQGYDFLMISDHDHFVDPLGLDPRGMTLIGGNEVTAAGPHILHIGARDVVAPDPDRQAVLDAIAADGRVAVMAHPNWEEHYNHCPQRDLERWTGYIGIEIYNGVVERLAGNPYALDRWDRLLSQGRRIWGFAHDDSHDAEDDARGWIMVAADGRSPEAITTALTAGQFYASTGVDIASVRVDGLTVSVRTANAQRIAAIGDYTRQLATADGPDMVFRIDPSAGLTYIRFECHGPGAAMAWTQPLFINRG